METSGSALGLKAAADAEPPKANKETAKIMAKEMIDKRRTKKIPSLSYGRKAFLTLLYFFARETEISLMLQLLFFASDHADSFLIDNSGLLDWNH